MTKVKDRDAYIVIAPTGKSKIYSVACRKIGSRDRYSVIATCQHEITADSLVDGLKLLQGEVIKIDTDVQVALVDIRAQLINERAKTDEARNKLRAFEIERREDIQRKEERIHGLERQLLATQKEAREKA